MIHLTSHGERRALHMNHLTRCKRSIQNTNLGETLGTSERFNQGVLSTCIYSGSGRKRVWAQMIAIQPGGSGWISIDSSEEAQILEQRTQP